MKNCKNCIANCTGAGKEGKAPNCTTYKDITTQRIEEIFKDGLWDEKERSNDGTKEN